MKVQKYNYLKYKVLINKFINVICVPNGQYITLNLMNVN